LDNETFTQDRAAITSKGEAGVLGASSSNGPHQFTVSDSEAFKSFSILPPVKGPDGLQSTAYFTPDIYRGRFVITNKCKYPEVALRWADYVYSKEVTERVTNGREGVSWVKPAPGALDVMGRPARFKSLPGFERGKLQNEFWADAIRYADIDVYYSVEVVPGSLTDLIMSATKIYEPFRPKESFPDKLYIKLAYVDEFGELETNIQTYIGQSIARFITGDLSLENDWDKYVKTLQDMGMKRYLQIYQESYDASRK
jgi:putative aldouronate transport system substrate-binding protein